MRWLIGFCLLLYVFVPGSPARSGDPKPSDEDSNAKLGYAIGHQVGSDFRRSGLSIDPNTVLAGLRDAIEGTQPRWTSGEMREALRRLEEGRGADSTESP